MAYFVTILNRTKKTMACNFHLELAVPAASEGYVVTSTPPFIESASRNGDCHRSAS